MLLTRQLTEKLSSEISLLIPKATDLNAHVLVEYTDLPKDKDITAIGLSLDKKFLTVGGRREHRVLQIERDAN